MTEKTSCQHCGTHLEFDVENANQFIDCPSCGKQTRLLLETQKKSASPHQTKFSRNNLWLLLTMGVIILFGSIVVIYCHMNSGTGELIGKFVGMLLACVICLLIGWFLLAHLVEVLTVTFILVGLFLIFSGIFDMISIATKTDGTVMQQIYALLEFVGGALVFCAAMILHLLRTRLNPPAKLD